MNNLSISLEAIANIAQLSDATLETAALEAARRNYESHGRPAYSRGDFRAAVLDGKFPELVLAEIRRNQSEGNRLADLAADAAEALAVLELPKGWAATLNGKTIALTGPYDPEMPARLRRLGGNWDAVTRQWNIPTEKHASVKRVFANAEKAVAQKEAAAAAARAAKERAKAEAAAQRAAATADAKRRAKAGIAARVRVAVGSCRVGDTLNGKTITGFGQSWTEASQKIRVTDDTACAHGMIPGLDYYPMVTVGGGQFCYAYFD